MVKKLGLSLVLSLTLPLLIAGCQAPPNIKALQDQNKSLENQLTGAKGTISNLQAQQRLLKQDIDELNRVINVLGTEKTSRVRESSSLRGQVREFIQSQVDSFKEFMVLGNLLDYVGGELVERQGVETKSLMVVDLANPMPKSGIITGIGAHFTRAGTFTAKVLRPVENNLVVIWESRPLTVTQPGLFRINFPVNVGVERGDVMAYYLPETIGVSFDTGTGDSRYQSRDVGIGSVIGKSSLQGASKRRAYSIGVFGLLNQ